MEIARSEGYDDIKITGVKLSMSTDFGAGSGSSWFSVNMVYFRED
jgi:hypothetical protein